MQSGVTEFRPEADCLLLVATYGEADTHYKILVRSFRPIAAIHRTTAERRDLTHLGNATGNR